MDITQVVEIPVSRKLTIDVPPGVPVGPIVIAYKPGLSPKRGKPALGCAKRQRGEDAARDPAGSRKDDSSKKWEIFMRGVNGFSDDFMAEGRLQGADQEREGL